MTIPVVPEQDSGQGTITIQDMINPYISGWHTYTALSNIPGEAVGWLVAQGWQITDIAYDETTVSPTPYYAMAKEYTNNWPIVNSLLIEYETAHNDAKWANEVRYNQVIEGWEALQASTHTHYESEITEQNTHVTTFIADLGTYMDDVATVIESTNTDLVADSDIAEAALTELNTKLADLEVNAAANTETIGWLLTDQEEYLSSFKTTFTTELAELDTNYAAHLVLVTPYLTDVDTDLTTFSVTQAAEMAALSAEYLSLVSDLETWLSVLDSDYTTHSATATAFLTGLGTTELARIQEKFAASLAVQTQQLVDRGFYASAILADITERNTRDENEEIAALNDRLNREKFENQHRLYGQQVELEGRTLQVKTQLYDVFQRLKGQLVEEAARLQNLSNAVTIWKTGQRDRMLEQVNQIVTQQLAGIDRKFAAELDVSRVTMTERDRLYEQLQDAVKAYMAGKGTYATQTMQKGSTLSNAMHTVVQEKMAEYSARLAGLQAKHSENMDLMKYQLDHRNQLMLGLYSFVERREDVGPVFSDLTQIVTALGDSGSGWVSA